MKLKDNPLAQLTEYELRNLAEHLVHSGHPNDLHRLLALETDRLQNVWYETKEAKGDTRGYLADVARALRLPLHEFATSQSLSTIGLQGRYALMTASLRSLAQKAPSDLMSILIHRGIWTPVQALAYTRQLTDPEQQVRAMATIMPHLSAPFTEEALNEAFKLAWSLPTQVTHNAVNSSYPRIRALVALAPYVPTPILRSILEETYAIIDTRVRDWMEVLTELAPHLSEPLLWEVMDVIESLKKNDEKIKTITALIPYLPETLKDEFLSRALCMAKETGHKRVDAATLAALANHLPQPLQYQIVQEMIERAQSSNDGMYQMDILEGMAPRLPIHLLQRALALAREMPRYESFVSENDLVPRETALAALLPRLAELGHMEDALAEILTIEEKEYRDLALKRTVCCTASSDTSRRAFEIIELIEYDRYRSAAIAGIAPHLPQPLTREVLELAITIRDVSDRTKALTAMAPYLPESLLRDALTTIWVVDDEDERAKAIAALYPYLPFVERIRARVCKEFLRGICAKAIECLEQWVILCVIILGLQYEPPSIGASSKGFLRMMAIAGLIEAVKDFLVKVRVKRTMMLPKRLRERGLLRILSAAENQGTANDRVRVVKELGSQRSVVLTGAVLGKAGQLAQAIEQDYERMEAMAALILHLHGFQQESFLNEVLNQVQLLGSDQGQVNLSVILIPYLPESEKGRVLRNVLFETLNTKSQSEQWRMLRLAQYLVDRPPEESAQLWSETAQLIATRTRSQALSDLASLAPVISALGGGQAVSATIRAIKDMGHWWP